jgi:hypothetical protein
MAISDAQKIDLLYKKVFGVAKTDTSANKSASNESIASPALLRGDNIWTQAGQIPAVAAEVDSIVEPYTGSSAVECDPDITTTPVSGVYPTWKTNLTDWIPSEFGASYFVKVYVDNINAANPTITGTQIFDSGSNGVGEWFFDYQAGILNFIGSTIPAVLTSSKSVYISGYRYVGVNDVADIGINTLSDVDVSILTSGSVLVWNSTAQKWTATTTLSQQTIEGGINDAGFF